MYDNMFQNVSFCKTNESEKSRRMVETFCKIPVEFQLFNERLCFACFILQVCYVLVCTQTRVHLDVACSVPMAVKHSPDVARWIKHSHVSDALLVVGWTCERLNVVADMLDSLQHLHGPVGQLAAIIGC